MKGARRGWREVEDGAREAVERETVDGETVDGGRWREGWTKTEVTRQNADGSQCVKRTAPAPCGLAWLKLLLNLFFTLE
jgi:hypothetical protein